MWSKWLPVLALMACSVLADELSLVRIGSTWRWQRGLAEPSRPPDLWRQPGFDDSAWPRALSGFAFDYWQYEASVIGDYFRQYSTIYLRCDFPLGQLESVAWLVLRVDYTGGFVAYLNGQEIVRRNLPGEPGTPVAYDQLAAFHARGAVEEIDVSTAINRLRSGANTLAIEWHSSDLSSSGAFVPELLANFTRGPFLQNTSTNQQVIVWKTHLPADTVVEYGATPELGQRSSEPTPVTNHVAALVGLAPDTLYYYRVSSSAGGRTALSPTFTFRTFKDAGAFSFIAVADIGLGSLPQYAIAKVMRDTAPGLVLLAGDLVYPYYTVDHEDFHFFSVYGEQMRQTPFFPTAGNHDVVYYGQATYFGSWFPPTNSVSAVAHAAEFTGPKHYYSFDQGDAHFVALFVPLMQGRFTLQNGSAQLAWLEADLAASRKPWKIIFVHQPMMTSDGHRFDDYNSNGILDTVELANLLLPLARRYGVQLVLSGHAHVYERFNPVQGVYQVVCGGGGGPLYTLTELDRASAQFWRAYHCVHVTLDQASLRLEALDQNGAVFDRMFLYRDPPPRQIYTATWNRAIVQGLPANDTDGNIAGQTFDLAGPPIPTVPGDFSNLGRAYVNYDHDYLYLGFEELMIYGDNNLFVFLETPRQAGIDSLAGLGNGVVDPAGEGVDGLDFLENLSFLNFRPSVACVLGDEYADGQFRSYPRTNYVEWRGTWPPVLVLQTNLGLNIGQGVFRLEPGLPDVPGVRLQQFNRSPQSAPWPGEQNANFIEVAILLRQVGLQPGDRFKLGAVVGGALYSTAPAEQSRFLDRSYLGYSLTGSGLGACVLEGLEVQLGPDLDPDGDGLLTARELQLGTDPNNPDTDQDGLPDGWEVDFGLDPLRGEGADGGEGDPDGDGMTNRQEYLAGTDPRAAASRLEAGVVLAAPNRVRVWWRAVPGRRYQIQQTDSLQHGFAGVPLPGFPRLAGASLEFVEIAFEGQATRFFRVGLAD